MRLSALDLVRYGKFTGKQLDFGPARPGKPDLHLVYGPNEAGKSTLFSAVLDLFFGIEGRSPYNFLHPYPAMRIGATVDTGGRSQSLFRVKRQQNTLIDAHDQPLPEGLLANAFGTVDRATYQLMFSLDDDSIEKGGESILRSEGELGALLFSASSGLPDLTGVMADLKGRTDAFYRPQARKHRLAELKAELDALKDERAAIDVSQREYTALRKTRDLATERHEAALAMRAALRVQWDAANAKLEGLPLLLRLRALRGDLAALSDLPDPPAVWHQMLPDLMRAETEIGIRLAQVAADIARRTQERDLLARDEAVLALRDDLRRLESSGLEARYRTAAQDMPSRTQERAVVAADLAARLLQLGRRTDENPEALLIPAAIIGRLRALAESHARLTERQDASRRELALSEAAHRTALDDVDTNGQPRAGRAPGATPARDLQARDLQAGDLQAGGLQALSDLLRALRREDFPLRQTAAREETARLEDLLSDQLASLPGRHDGESLARVPVPAEGDLADWSFRSERVAERLRLIDERRAEIALQLATAQAERDSLLAQAEFADDGRVAELRRARDAAWRAHRETLAADTADRFESALDRDDRASALRLTQTEQIARSRALAVTIADLVARQTAYDQQRAEQLAERSALGDAIAQAAEACNLPADLSLPRLEDWLQRRLKTLETRTALRAMRQKQAQADADEARAMARLAAAFGEDAALPDDFETALAFGERVLAAAQAEAAEGRARSEALKRTEAALASRRSDAQAAEAAVAEWAQSWADVLSGLWLAPDGVVPSPAEVMPSLTVLAEIDRLVQRRNDFDHRIQAMGRDQAAFVAAVSACCTQLDLEVGDDPLAVYTRLLQRVAAAEQVEALFDRLSQELDERAREAHSLAESQERHDASKRDMLAFFGCTELGDVASHLETAKNRTRLRERIGETESDLAARLRVATAEEAEMILVALDAEGLRREAAELSARHDEADRMVQDRHAELRDAERGLEKAAGDDAAAFIEERRRTVLADIEEQALAYLRLRAGLLAADMALRLYRERHRSAMMQRASAAFATISGGEYEGLSTEMEKGTEFLLVRSVTGATKLARDLSKGTRFQLYLALRMAGFHEISAQREALPFIADDIMETFDDGRAFHAFRLMAEMAGVGQVIYLTHHEHLCAIAREACPDVVLHRL
ncbi:sugar translocase [Rhizobium sp. Leaf384]|uniref:ATP-binding protein n=1 Tax=Rhizobium sp. Leaf384 TaxID=1736358 RepID=UPI0007151429|nr:AAA family ATPase [Rhizobium sp. Leaf384]KQS80351.1 sugar translocase [Rhizobium sp. Leaf384]